MIWRNKKISKRQGENYVTGYLLDYDSIKNDYRLIAVDLSIQIELDPERIQQIEFVGQLKETDNNGNATDCR